MYAQELHTAGKWNVQCAVQFQAAGVIIKSTVVIMVSRKQIWYIKQQGKCYCLVLPAEIELLPGVDLMMMMMAFPSSLLLLLNADNSLPTFLLLPIVFLLPGPPWHPLAQSSLFSLSLYQLPAVRQETKFVLALQYHHVVNNICCRSFCVSKIDPVNKFSLSKGGCCDISHSTGFSCSVSNFTVFILWYVALSIGITFWFRKNYPKLLV